MVVLTVVLIGWSMALQAPLEEPANPSSSPNPSKAPWYFLGLQEMLVYFDPWLAGVVFPGLIIVGLMAIPYIDTNPKGNGYFTLKERKWEISTFLFGFLILWILLVILGTFLRGPNWNFFGPYEFWDIHKLEALVNVNLSEYIVVTALGMGLPKNPLIRDFQHSVLRLHHWNRSGGLLARMEDVSAEFQPLADRADTEGPAAGGRLAGSQQVSTAPTAASASARRTTAERSSGGKGSEAGR